MTENIDFYFDFVSPYTYIGHKRVELEGGEFNFTYKPILLGGLHKLWGITPHAFIEAKKQFMIQDCKMVSKKLKIDFKFNSKFPFNSIKFMRGCLVLNEERLKKYINLVFDAFWKEDKDITDKNVITKILEEIEINFDDFNQKTENADIKAKLKDLTTEAYKKNIFGTPTFVAGDKLFWGQDRFEFAIKK